MAAARGWRWWLALLGDLAYELAADRVARLRGRP